MNMGAEAGRKSVRHDFHHTAEGVAVILRRLNFSEHVAAGLPIGASNRVGVDSFGVMRFRHGGNV